MTNRLQKKMVEEILPKIAKLQKLFFEKRDEYLEKRSKTFQDEYYIRFHREPKDIEVTKYKKDIIMKFGLLAYFSVMILLFIIWLSIKESGVFG